MRLGGENLFFTDGVVEDRTVVMLLSRTEMWGGEIGESATDQKGLGVGNP